MGTQAPRQSFSHAPLYAIGGVMLASIVAAGIGRITGPVGLPPKADIVVARDVRFTDRADGGVDIFSGRDPQPVEVIAATKDSFLRATMRTLARARALANVGEDVPFRLTEWSDGRLTLDDLGTGRHLEMEAFGETNEAVFAQVLASAAKVP